MNIFFLDESPELAAKFQCDKHVVKMILESAQLLSTAHHELDSPYADLCYKPTHRNHPCAKWARECDANYKWLYSHFIALGQEYTRRYGKIHKTIRERAEVLSNLPPNIPKRKECTKLPLCMPDQYKDDDNPVEAYRNYYRGEKVLFARWKLEEPNWWRF